MVTGIILLGMIGHWEILLIVLVIVLIFFGGKKIPELMKGMGKGVRSFKDGLSGEDEKDDKNSDISKN
ncbi:MAG TPA: twin-arginine translocase TatA/TatE family subunit [Bacteroidales bacterium]|nr:twin-arginine translocase TatA/TatE family subunit [Bacteroidales bacterium]HNS45949.1 twin-arginine translocase TatA/TatE family subunit [Bacteroidales bacterium]